MPRSGTIGTPNPYSPFGNFVGLPFWGGGLTLLAAAPGVGKTSWILRMIFEASCAGIPAAIGCYEHTPEELKYRLQLQAEAAIGGPHGTAYPAATEEHLARGSEAVLLSLSDKDDTIRNIELMLVQDYNFPEYGPALLGVDYLQRVPVLGLTAMLSQIMGHSDIRVTKDHYGDLDDDDLQRLYNRFAPFQ
ncbi:MAG: hypothetical protein JW726_15880 [Anaerolineales bacterium]|nr:hypothetical protein [Anaerolineales bacterium]